MNVKILITASVIIHGLLMFSAGIKIEKSTPVLMVSSTEPTENTDIAKASDVLEALKNIKAVSTEENSEHETRWYRTNEVMLYSPPSQRSKQDIIYSLQLNIALIILISMSAIFHIGSLFKLPSLIKTQSK